jgi:hypothetical protein
VDFERLYQELAHGAQLIPALAAGISPAESRAKPSAESWSVLEVICHLCDEEREDFRQRLDIILHRPQDDWPPIDPVGWVTARQYNERDLGEVLNNFKAERTQSLDWLRSLPSPDWKAEYATRFGTMKAGDMLGAWVAHDNLHTRQLVELRRGRVVSMAAPYDVRYAGDW